MQGFSSDVSRGSNFKDEFTASLFESSLQPILDDNLYESQVKKEIEQLDDLLNENNMYFKSSRWQVLFSDNFRKSFQKLKSSRIKRLVIQYLMKLACGWRPKKINVDQKCENSLYIVKHFKVDVYDVVCSIDLVKDTFYKQVLKVWDILPMNETTKLSKRLDNIFSMYTDNFIRHCNKKLFERNLEVPKTWSLSNDIIRFKNPSDTKLSTSANANSVESRGYAEYSKVSESLLLMKFYSLSIGAVNHLLSDKESRELNLPFEVTDEEREIITFPKSSFILGRSGTGKTTILTMKLYQRLQLFYLASRDSVPDDSMVEESAVTTLRQLFVTVSPKLCYAVKNHVSQLKSFATENFTGNSYFTGVADVDEMAEFKDIPDTFHGIKQEKYPLIITFHKFLMMLDGTLGNSYFKRFHDVTDASHHEGRRSVALQTFMRNREVTYDRFCSSYWPYFNARLTKNLDASRVFTEIMSHIKGGLQYSDSKRSRQDYISLSKSRVSTLSEGKRAVIYDIFEDYEKVKLERGDFDLADFVNDIHLRIKNEDISEKMDFVYIDEVQDLSMRQISLFRYICKNVDEGFVFSGDTAQTIARGIDFRFEDVRSLFYNEFLAKSRDCDSSGREEKGLISDMFNLYQNFRTHTGVLRLAQSVIDLLCHYFPHSIDSLAPETSFIHGESPVVLEPGSEENLIVSIFGHSRNCSGKWVGFGADQVILVRDDAAKKEVSSYVGRQALILTILECKGLEFQDVLLYNFFGSSPFSNQWRVVYEFLKEKDLLGGDCSMSYPTFSQSRHNILCSELKHLYVAITRTKQRLWICENNMDLSKPMLDYWRRLCLVQVTKIDDSLAETMQRASSPEEWKSQGIKLFLEKNYEMAIMCFEKAGEVTWEERSKASGLRAAADSLRSSNPDEANVMLREAAEIFDSIDRVESAAECFCDLGDYERAGRIYFEKSAVSNLDRAGECFCLAGNYKTAAEVYARGNFFRECLSACTKGNIFDLGLQYVQYWKEQTSFDSAIMARFKEIDKIAQEFLENCAVECYNAKDNASLMKFVRAFNSTESKYNFLNSLDCLEELLLLEEESENFNEAAKIAKTLGDVLREVDLLEKAKQFANACMLLHSYVLSNSLWVSGNPGWPLKTFPQKEALLKRSVCLAQKVSETFHASICAEVEVFSHEQRDLSEMMLCYSSSKQCSTPLGEILSVRRLLDAHHQVKPPRYEFDTVVHLDRRSFEERISRNQVSGGTLFYVWNLWKAWSLSILKCLDNLERSDFIKPEGTDRFCLNYFGVRLADDLSVTLNLLNPDAAWVKNVDKGLTRKNRNVTTLEARHFASAARKYWHQELVYVGLKVLEALQELYKSSMVKRLPKYYPSITLLQIFDVAKFFLESKFNMSYNDSRKLQNFLQLSMSYYEYVFPLDSRESLSETMMSLRETVLSNNLLEERFSRYISMKGRLTQGQIGNLVMIMLGSGKLNHALYDRIAERLSNDSAWKYFLHLIMAVVELYTSKKSEYLSKLRSECNRPVDNGAVSERPSLCFEFFLALRETYRFNMRAHDFISPNCLFYLVDRLLILAPHCLGYFFTSASSFAEYLMWLPDNFPGTCFLDITGNHYSITAINFVLRLVQECLCDRVATAEWIRTSSIDYKYYFPVLLQKLFVILCISCLNYESSFRILFKMLRLPGISSQLPRGFFEALRPIRRDDTSYVSAVASAFKVIGDPLVIVALTESSPKFEYPDTIFLELRSFRSRKDAIEALLPAEVSQTTSETIPATDSTSIAGVPLYKRTIAESSKTEMETDSKSVTVKEMLQIKWSIIREASDAIESLRVDDKDSMSIFWSKKLEVEEYMNYLKAYVAKLTEQRDSGEAAIILPMIYEIINDFCLLDASDIDVKTLRRIGGMLNDLEAMRPRLDSFLCSLNDSNGVISEEIDDRVVLDIGRGTDDGEKADSTVGVADSSNQNQNAASAQGKGNNKKTKKRGKGGRRK